VAPVRDVFFTTFLGVLGAEMPFFPPELSPVRTKGVRDVFSTERTGKVDAILK
jgi:hypothetical protein